MNRRIEMRRALPPLGKRASRPGVIACLFALCMALGLPAWAQKGVPAPAHAAAQSEAPQDALGRATPRGAVLGFLVAARNGDDELAARYLNTRLRGEAAATLARQLFTVLDRRLPPVLAHLSDKPEGSRADDPSKPNTELVGTIVSAKGNVDIFVERVQRGPSVQVWLFSSKTLDAVPDLYAESRQASLQDLIPESVVNYRIAGIPVFHWTTVFVGMPLFYYLVTLLGRLLGVAAGSVRRRLRHKPDLPDPDILPAPVRLLLLAFATHWVVSRVSLPLFGRQFWSSTVAVIAIAATVWLLILVNSRVEQYARRILDRHKFTEGIAVLRLVRRTVDGVILFAGALVMLYQFGVNPTAVLAGLGVGGIAVALAAQKTLENVIGGVSLILDRVARAGDNIKVGGIQGTIDDMSLRSTRIRTPDRTVVSVPNGQMANMTLENYSLRDKFRFHPVLALRYGTTSQQIQAVCDRVRGLLAQCPDIEPGSVRVNFGGFTESALEVQVLAYLMVDADDLARYLAIQETLLLGIVDCIESAGAQMARPLPAVLADAFNSRGAAGRASIDDSGAPPG